jgi:glycosyltransferase involved in cell wall biosynthesis
VADASLKLLFATRTSPFAGESGSGTYVFDLLRHLATHGFCIHCVWTEPPDLVPSRGWYQPPAASRAVFSLEIMGALRVGSRFWQPSVVWLPLKARLSHAVKSPLRRLGLLRPAAARAGANTSSPQSPTGSPPHAAAAGWGSPASSAEIAAVRSAIHRFKPDVVLANYAWMSPAIRETSPKTPPFAVVTHDVRHRQLHLRDGRVQEVLGEHMSPQMEAALLSPADALIAIQQPEADVFARLLPGKPVVTAPMAVRPQPVPLPPAASALFVGSGHGPNIAGLRWFLEEVWPLVRQTTPDARLLIAGGVSRHFPAPLPAGVTSLGRVDDIGEAYSRAAVVVAPIHQGSGVKIKILEAISFGRPCVTTSVGLEGLEAMQPALRVANTPQDFAAETSRLLADPQQTAAAGAALTRFARTQLSPEATLLRSLATQSSRQTA